MDLKSTFPVFKGFCSNFMIHKQIPIARLHFCSIFLFIKHINIYLYILKRGWLLWNRVYHISTFISENKMGFAQFDAQMNSYRFWHMIIQKLDQEIQVLAWRDQFIQGSEDTGIQHLIVLSFGHTGCIDWNPCYMHVLKITNDLCSKCCKLASFLKQHYDLVCRTKLKSDFQHTTHTICHLQTTLASATKNTISFWDIVGFDHKKHKSTCKITWINISVVQLA